MCTLKNVPEKPVNASQIKVSKRNLEFCEQVSFQLSFKSRYSFLTCRYPMVGCSKDVQRWKKHDRRNSQNETVLAADL